MNPRTTLAGPAAIRPSRRLPRGLVTVCDQLICTLFVISLVMSVSSAAPADALEPVEDALVLYIGQDIPGDGDDVINTIDDVISEDALGQALVQLAGKHGRSPVLFRDAFPNVACYAAWLHSFDAPNPRVRVRHPTPTPLFFRELEGYRSRSKDLELCSVNQGPEPPLIPVTNSAHLPLEVSDTTEPDWEVIEYHLARKLGEFAPRKGESYSVSALICPRVLQILTPVRAAVRLRAHAKHVADLLREVAAGIQEPRNGLYPTIKAAVLGTPTVYFFDEPNDFIVDGQYEYNLFDIYFERVSQVGDPASDAGTAELDADSCLSRGAPGRPAALNAELNLDRTLRFIWLDSGSHKIPSPREDPLIQRVLDELAGREPQAEVPADPVLDEDAIPLEPVEGTEHEDGPTLQTDASSPDAAEGRNAKTGPPDNAFQTWHVIEAYEDRDRFERAAPRVENSDTATKRAKAVRGLLDEGTNFLVTGFGPVEDFSAVDVGRIVMMEDDETFEPEPPQPDERNAHHNRTAFVTVLRVPQASPDEASLRIATLETLMDHHAFTLANVRASTEFCVRDDMIRPIRRDLASYPTYFLGDHYQPFKLLTHHKQAVILVCGGHGPHGPLTSGQLGPVLLRALHEHKPGIFRKNDSAIRATYLHKVGDGDARRYYLFGHSILTHFQLGTTAGVLQSGIGDGTTSLCKKFPGLRILQNTTQDQRTTEEQRTIEHDICLPTSPNSFKVKPDRRVDRALFHLVLPTTLADQLACAPTLAEQPAETPTNGSLTAASTHQSASHRPLGCADEDVLPDPHDLLVDLKHRSYVFRAAIDVAYEFRQR